MKVRKAVIPAAGLGTRFLPATKSQPKEMLPVIDKPGIQYVVEEALRAGCDDILIVTGRGKSSIEDHFDRSLELERHLETAGKKSELDDIRAIAELANIHYVRQKEPLGFGHAVLMAKDHVGDNPFVVMVGDEIVPEPLAGESDLLPRLIELFDEHAQSVIAVQEVAPDKVSAYGIIEPDPMSGDVVRVRDMIEKPPQDEAPSNLASRGRYVFTPDLFEAIEGTQAGVGNEIQLTDAIRSMAADGRVLAHVYAGLIYDVGKKLDYLRATVELTLRRPDLAEPFRLYLEEVAGRSADE